MIELAAMATLVVGVFLAVLLVLEVVLWVGAILIWPILLLLPLVAWLVFWPWAALLRYVPDNGRRINRILRHHETGVIVSTFWCAGMVGAWWLIVGF